MTATASRAATKGWSVGDAVAHIVKRCRSLSKPPRLVAAEEMGFLLPRLQDATVRELVLSGLVDRATNLFRHVRDGSISHERLGWAVRPALAGAEIFLERLNLTVGDRFVNGLNASAAEFRASAVFDRKRATGLERIAEGKDQIAAVLEQHKVACARQLPQKGKELNGLVEMCWMDGGDD